MAALRDICPVPLPWCINTGKPLIPLTLLFLAQKRNLLIPLELSRVMHQGTRERTLRSAIRVPPHAQGNTELLPHAHVVRAFAVGTALTGGPPHRSQRALLTHWAPTSGHDAQSLFGIRVQCSMLDDCHQPSVVDGIEESTDVRVEYPVHFLVNRAPLSRQATCRIRSSAFRRSGDRT